MFFLFTVLLAAAAQPAAAQVAASTAAVTVDEIYQPVNLRDPLLPSSVYGDSKGKARPGGAQPAVVSATFTVYGLALTGIMEDSRGRQALLRDTATGGLYTLKGGRLLDSKKKAVPGVSGVVKGRQVVLMTEDKKIHQLTLREKE
ncbi:MAG: hypothetical protein NTY45_06305 [Elusimicrobia bacterium]|nr:hypothetical protein [Elusimicrobiota bacterium]